MVKKITSIRAYMQEMQRLKNLSFELSAIQKKKVSTPEVLRRTLNIPNLKGILIDDARSKGVGK